MSEPVEIDYVECMGCDTPCYIFDLSATGSVTAALCAECGNDDPLEFRIPGASAGGEAGHE